MLGQKKTTGHNRKSLGILSSTCFLDETQGWMMLECLPQARSSVSCRYVCFWAHYSVPSLCRTAEWTPNERTVCRVHLREERRRSITCNKKIINISFNFIVNLGLLIIIVDMLLT
jgi:hypothetical protein